MRPLAVLAEPFPVIGGNGDDGLLGNGGEQLLQRGVDVRDFSLVVVGERIRRIVRRVRIEEVNPDEIQILTPARDPAARGGHDLGSPSLREGDSRAGAPEGVVVDVEPLVEAESGVHGKSTDESGRRVPGGLQDLGEGLHLRGKPEATVVADPMVRGVGPGQDRAMRGQRERALSEDVLESRPLPGKGVERRRRGLASVGRQSVRPKRIDGHENDASRIARAAGGAAREQQQANDAPPPGHGFRFSRRSYARSCSRASASRPTSRKACARFRCADA
jgi:hypothetical protein